jgi:hypothetical protein
VRRFRVVCARRGIDPLTGATSFQVVHYMADQQAARLKPKRWWLQHDFWLDSQPQHSEVEEEAIWNLFIEGYRLEMNRAVRAMRLRRMTMPLRELHQRQVGRGTKD